MTQKQIKVSFHQCPYGDTHLIVSNLDNGKSSFIPYQDEEGTLYDEILTLLKSKKNKQIKFKHLRTIANMNLRPNVDDNVWNHILKHKLKEVGYEN